MAQGLLKSTVSWLDEGEGRFTVWTPLDVDIVKASAERLPVDGIASTEDEDADGETIVQKGIDWSDAVGPFGGLTLEHPAGSFNSIGDIESTYATTVNGFAATGIKGAIWRADKLGGRVAEKLEGMKKSGARTRWGLSVEGRATKRRAGSPKIIDASKITTVAVTSRPKNRLCLVDPIMASLFGAAGLRAMDVLDLADGAMTPADAAELRRAAAIAKGLSPKDVAVLRLAMSNPYLTFAEARAAVEKHWS